MRVLQKIISPNDDKTTTREDVEYFIRDNEKYLNELIKYTVILNLINNSINSDISPHEYSLKKYHKDITDLTDELFYDWNDYSVLKFFLYNFILLNRIELAYNVDIKGLDMNTYSILNRFEKMMNKEYSKIVEFNEEILAGDHFIEKIYKYSPHGDYGVPLLQSTRTPNNMRINGMISPESLLNLVLDLTTNFPESKEFIEYFKKSIKVPYYTDNNYIDESNYYLLLSTMNTINNIMDYSSTYSHNEAEYYRDVNFINVICQKLNGEKTVEEVSHHPILIHREYSNSFKSKINQIARQYGLIINSIDHLYSMALTIQLYLEYGLNIQKEEAIRITLDYITAFIDCFTFVKYEPLIDYVKVFEEYFSKDHPPLEWLLNLYSRELDLEKEDGE